MADVAGALFLHDEVQDRHTLILHGGPDNMNTWGPSIEITVRSLVDLGEYEEENHPVNVAPRTGHRFRLNGNTELKILRWGAGWEDQPGIYFTVGDFEMKHIFDWQDPDDNPNYAPLVAHFQAHLRPEEPGQQGQEIPAAGGRRRRSTRSRRIRRH